MNILRNFNKLTASLIFILIALVSTGGFYIKNILFPAPEVAGEAVVATPEPTPFQTPTPVPTPTPTPTPAPKKAPIKTVSPTPSASSTSTPSPTPTSLTSTSESTQQSSLSVSLNCVASDSAKFEKHIDYTVSATVSTPTDTGVWTTITDEKEAKTIIWQGSGYTSSFSGSGHEIANSIRGSGQILFTGDGRNYTVKLYRETYSDATPSLNNSPVAQTSASKSCN